MSSNKPPIAKFRNRGLTVNVWERANEKGTFHDITIDRSYKDGDDWKSTQSIPADDIQNLRKLMDMAHTAILERRAELKEQSGGHTEEEEILY